MRHPARVTAGARLIRGVAARRDLARSIEPTPRLAGPVAWRGLAHAGGEASWTFDS